VVQERLTAAGDRIWLVRAVCRAPRLLNDHASLVLGAVLAAAVEAAAAGLERRAGRRLGRRARLLGVGVWRCHAARRSLRLGRNV